AVAGVQPQTGTVWKQANRYQVPRMVLVNKMDRQGADFYRVLKQVKDQLPGLHTTWTNAHAIQLPIGAEAQFTGLVDLIEMKAYSYEETDSFGRNFKEIDIPEDMKELVATHRHELEEAIVETNDDLMHKYLEGEKIAVDELKDALRTAVCDNRIVPVLCGS